MARRKRRFANKSDPDARPKRPATAHADQQPHSSHTWPVDWHVWAIAAALAALVCVVFGPSANFEFVTIGDEGDLANTSPLQQSFRNSAVWAFKHRDSALWQPLVDLSHAVDYRLFGLAPRGHHLSNIAWHAASIVALFFALCQLTRAGRTDHRPSTWRSALIAGLVAVGPWQAPAVGWMAARGSVISLLFASLLLLAYAWYCQRSTWWRLTIVTVFFALGLMCGPALWLMPLLLVVLDFWPLERLNRGASSKPGVCRTLAWGLGEKLPLLLLSCVAAFAMFTTSRPGSWQAIASPTTLSARAAILVGEMGGVLTAFFDPLIGQASAVLLPSHVSLSVAFAIAALLACATAVAAWQTQRRPYLLTGWLWMLLTLVPSAIVFGRASAPAIARVSSLPTVGLAIISVYGAAELADRWRLAALPRVAISATALLLLAGVCRSTLGAWRDSETLFAITLAGNPDSGVAHSLSGHLAARKGDHASAVLLLRRAVEDRATATEQDYLQLARSLLAIGELDEAEECYRELSEQSYEPSNALLGLATVSMRRQDADAARSWATKAQAAGRANQEAYRDLAAACLALDRYDLATMYMQQAVESSPESALCQNDLGIFLFRVGRLRPAEAALQKAAQLSPNWSAAWLNLGLVQSQRGELTAAEESLAKATQLAPNSAEAWYLLGSSQAARRQNSAAGRSLSRALEIDPQHSQARLNLGWALHHLGRRSEAIDQYRQVLQLQPNLPEPMARIAWLLATHPDVASRDATQAIALAEQAIQLAGGAPGASQSDTLAAAYAAAGRYEEAVKTLQPAVDHLGAGDPDAAPIHARLALYQDGRAYIEPLLP